MLAVSQKVTPSSTACRNSGSAASASSAQGIRERSPKLMQPRVMRLTLSPEVPRRVYCTWCSSRVVAVGEGAGQPPSGRGAGGVVGGRQAAGVDGRDDAAVDEQVGAGDEPGVEQQGCGARDLVGGADPTGRRGL